MLVLTRKKGEAIVIAGEITVTVLEIRGDKIRLGVEAPKDIEVNREEVQERKDSKCAGQSTGKTASSVPA